MAKLSPLIQSVFYEGFPGITASIDTLQSEYEALKSEATQLTGDLLDIPRRVAVLRFIVSRK